MVEGGAGVGGRMGQNDIKTSDFVRLVILYYCCSCIKWITSRNLDGLISATPYLEDFAIKMMFGHDCRFYYHHDDSKSVKF